MDLVTNDEAPSFLQIKGDDNSILNELNTYRQSGILCDVKLKVDGQSFPAHKAVLAANSRFFFAMFTTEMLEKDKTSASVSTITATAMESLLDFMYTGQIQIHVQNVFELLEASSYLLVEKVKEACCRFLQRILDMENCLMVLSMADTFSCSGLIQTVTQYVNREFSEVAKTESFLKLSKEEIIKFLSSDDISIENEDQLLEIVIHWISYDPEVRKDFCGELLKLVRLPFVSLSQLHDLRHEKELNDLIIPRLVPTSKGATYANVAGEITARKSCRSMEVIVVAGGCDNSAILNSVCCFVPVVGKWVKLSAMKLPRWRLQLVTLQDNIFAIGGLRDVCVKEPAIPFIERFSGQSNSWDATEHQPAVCDVELDSFCAVSTSSSTVLLVGGLDPKTSRCTSQVSSFELKDKIWLIEQREPLLFARAGHCLVSSGDRVYALGGFQEPNTLAIREGMRTVECYDPAKDAWTCVQPMTAGRQFSAAVTLNDDIFIFGGYDGQKVLRSCEVYNVKLNRWQHIAPMRYSRMKHSAVAHDGKIYVIGGVSNIRKGSEISSVECYIPEENLWISAPDMPVGRFDHQCYFPNVGYKFLASVLEESQ
ncbi:Kelch-like protein 12 [Stylophora pistillata]|uniref:Kelch-like protein 12 n=2 Tax=Stylophora pistillata TaxID=50429 RepID=A0A2B4S1Q9_STYPI|nr:Kelch-like protein 12 [Stylophora pistillata]